MKLKCYNNQVIERDDCCEEKTLKRYKTTSLTWFFVLMMFQLIIANLAHPVTPVIIQTLQLPAYIFGLAFASMSFSNFLFAPLWGRLSDRIGRIKIYTICCFGYAIGQFLFFQATSEISILLARAVAGVFIGGIGVTQLTYVLDRSTPQNRAFNLTVHATLFTLAGAIGYLLGGFVGDYSLNTLFLMQVGGLIIAGLLLGNIMLDTHPNEVVVWTKKELIRASNPFRAFVLSSQFIAKSLWLFLFAALFATMGSVAYDQSFNYFIRDQFGFSPSYNGLLKAGFGLMGLFLNSTLCLWIIRKTQMRLPLALAIFLAGTSAIVAASFPQINSFLWISVAYFAANTVFIVLIQTNAGAENRQENSGAFMGIFSSMKSVGMIFGSMFAGLVYGIKPTYSFLFSGSMFLIALFFIVIYILFKRKLTRKIG